jgi:hypothetical protein
MAQSAVAAIRTGCNMLAEGKAEIDKFKKTVEKGVGDAKAIYSEVVGIWGWIQSLFGQKPKAKPVALPVVDAKIESKPEKRRKEPEKELTYEEFQARQVHEICEHLKVYFEVIRELKAHCRELEEQSLTTERVADSAIDRIELEWQMKQLATQVKEAMIYTPERLGLQALYSRFLEMYDQILEEQEFARAVQAKKERDKKWQRELLRNHRIDRGMAAFWVAVVILWMWGLFLSFGWLVRIPAGSLRGLLF